MVEFWHLKEWSLDQGLLWSHVSRFFTDERQFWLSGTCYRALGVPFGPLRVWESIVRMLEVDFCVKFSKTLIKFQRAFERISYNVRDFDPHFWLFEQNSTICARFYQNLFWLFAWPFFSYESKFWASRGWFCALKFWFLAFESQSLLASWSRFLDPWASIFGRWATIEESNWELWNSSLVLRESILDLWALRVDFLLIKSISDLCYPNLDSWECNVIKIWRIFVHGVFIPQMIGF